MNFLKICPMYGFQKLFTPEQTYLLNLFSHKLFEVPLLYLLHSLL